MSEEKGYLTRAEKREQARQLAKEILRNNPIPPPRWRTDLTLTLAVGVLGIILVFMPPQTERTTLLWLVAMFGCGLYPALHFTELALRTRKKWIPKIVGSCVFGILVITFGIRVWPPLKRHVLSHEEWSAFETPLKEQQASRDEIQVLCPQMDEGTCIYAAQYVNIFRDAGWTVQSNKVERVIMESPLAGITIFRKGTGSPDPNNWRSGVWTRVTPSLVSVAQAFENVGIEPGSGNNPQLPEGAIAVYFGPEKQNEGESTDLTNLMNTFRKGFPKPK